MKKKTIYLFLVLGILILAAVLLFCLWDSSGRRGAELSPQGLSSTSAEQEAAGGVGEVLVSNPATGEEEPLKTALMPPALFNVQGTLTKLYDNGFAMETLGFSFADGQPREVEVLYQDTTVTTLPDGASRYQGLAGLSHLRINQLVLVESNENIRGKLKFKANYINLLP